MKQTASNAQTFFITKNISRASRFKTTRFKNKSRKTYLRVSLVKTFEFGTMWSYVSAEKIGAIWFLYNYVLE